MQWKLSLALVGAAVLSLAGALVWWARQVQRPANGNPAAFLASGGKQPGMQVAVLLGASIIHGRVSTDVVDQLRRRFAGTPWRFVNAGVNGDLAFNALQRLDAVIACQPDAVLILVGTNDVQASLSERVARLALRSKHLPATPSLDWYDANLRAIVTRLQAATSARIALYALPVLGEDLAAPANEAVCRFNSSLRSLAVELGVAYLPLYETEAKYLATQHATAGPPYSDNPVLVMGAALQHYLLGRSYDAISRSHGFLLTPDGIHLNSVAAGMAADLAAAFLSQSAGATR